MHVRTSVANRTAFESVTLSMTVPITVPSHASANFTQAQNVSLSCIHDPVVMIYRTRRARMIPFPVAVPDEKLAWTTRYTVVVLAMLIRTVGHGR